MTLGHFDNRRRRRRRIWLAVMKWMFLLLGIMIAGGYAYRMGILLAEQETLRMGQQISDLSERLSQTRRESEERSGELAAARTREAELRQLYERDVPAGGMKEIVALARERMAAGVAAERLAEVLRGAQNQRSCDAPVSRRFVVQTPIHKGANDAVTFGDNAITVTAEGRSATSPSGGPEGWFDPAQPVNVRFVRLGGESAEVSGVLPLHRSVVLGEWEYRFTMTSGDRGFLRVTGDRCRYP